MYDDFMYLCSYLCHVSPLTVPMSDDVFMLQADASVVLVGY